MTSWTSLSSASVPDCFCYFIFLIAYELLDHVTVTFGLFVVQTKLGMLISRDILNIYHAYAEWAWHFLGFRVFAEFVIYGFLSMMCLSGYQEGRAARTGQGSRTGCGWSQCRGFCLNSRCSASETLRYERRPWRHFVACQALPVIIMPTISNTANYYKGVACLKGKGSHAPAGS